MTRSFNVEDIRRNSNDFSFIDQLGNFVNNFEFAQGYREMKTQLSTKYSYVWQTLSAIGNDYAETIYENVLNYIDNASNIDLCKVKVLQSMIKMVGMKYDVLDSFEKIPVEIANLMDIVSINKSYLVNSEVFKKAFIDELSATGCLVDSTLSSTLSDEVYLSSIADDNEKDTYIEKGKYYWNKLQLDDYKYQQFLQQVYLKVLSSFVFMQYADAENGLSTQNQCIYQYLKDELRGEQLDPSIEQLNEYDRQIQNLKIKYNIDKTFDQQKIVDDIENGIDSYDNYNLYQQQILSFEIQHRQSTYAFNKTYEDDEQKFLGYNLTRYSYYREKKVKEYFSFIENTYNNLLVESSVRQSIGNENAVLSTYSKDCNYFVLDQNDKKYLLEYDSLNKELQIQTSYIIEIAKLLAEQTMQIAEIREQIKIQMQKNYMRGTFLLISYVVNEFLKYNISDKYGSMFATEDTNVPLSAFLASSLSSGNNVKLIEYYDNTEYFNITRDHDLSALNYDAVNEKFWDNFYNKIGINTNDIPLAEIENFYINQMNLKKDEVDDVTQFLSIIFEYGANPTFIYNEDTNDQMQKGDFVCKMRDGRWIGDPSYVIKRLQENVLSVNQIYEDVKKYIDSGYTSIQGAIDEQIDDLQRWIGDVFYYNEISNANEELRDGTFETYDANLENIEKVAAVFEKISADYESLKANEKYEPYYYHVYEEKYIELGTDDCYFYDKLSNFMESCENGFVWENIPVISSLSDMLCTYNQLSIDLYNELFSLSVWPKGNNSTYSPTCTMYWPTYSPNYEEELTAVTMSLKNYLVSQTDVNRQNALQHLQNHYDKLLGYKEEINRILTECENAYAKLEAYKDAVEAGSGVKITTDLCKTWSVWDAPVYITKVIPHVVTNADGSQYVEYGYVKDSKIFGWTLTSDTVCSNGISPGDGIREQLQKLQQRCSYYRYSVLNYKNEGALKRIGYDYADGGFYPCTIVQKNVVSYRIVVGRFPKGDGTVEVVLGTTQQEYDEPKYESFDPQPFGAEPGSKVYPWKDYYSSVAEQDIIKSFELACENLPAYIKLINSELRCLGFGLLANKSPSIDSVRNDTKDSYDELILKIDTLDDYIHKGNEVDGWWALANRTATTHDSNLYQYRDRIQRIEDINLSSAKKYNIQYINSEFFKLDDRLQSLLKEYEDYFSEYFVNGTFRLDKQISAIAEYVNKRDAKSKQEVIQIVEDISARYLDQILEFDLIAANLCRQDVISVENSYAYVLSNVKYKEDIADGSKTYPFAYENAYNYLDYLLSGAYIPGYNETYPPHFPYLSSNGSLNWIADAYVIFDETADSQIKLKIPYLPEYNFTLDMLKLARRNYLKTDLSSKQQLPNALQDVIKKMENDQTYVSSQISVYQANKEIYLKYNGTDIGYDPFYNYKNQTYSSYQIHPYLYNFVEKSNIAYPLANNFFVAFGKEYEMDLYKTGIDEIVGKYGNVINTWKSQLFDWTSYQTEYEKQMHTLQSNSTKNLPIIAYTGAFFPPALDAFLADPEGFIQDVQDDNEQSFYYHLNLTDAEIDIVVEQLKEYEAAIRQLVQRQTDVSIRPALSTEYDIYKFGVDANGNSLFLYKTYEDLYRQHANDSKYVPSYNEKKNTVGELWMRKKNHPLAFPAFDLRDGYKDISQYNIDSNPTSKGSPINEYIKDLNQHFSSKRALIEMTRDLVGRNSRSPQKQNLRCFFDMEFDPTKRAVLLSVPYATGFRSKQISQGIDDPSLLTYANSSIVIGNLTQIYDYDNNLHICNFAKDSSINNGIAVNIDNIPNPGILHYQTDEHGGRIPSNKPTTSNVIKNLNYEFVGFAKNGNYIFALFARKYFSTTNSFLVDFNLDSSRIKRKPSLLLHYTYYKYGTVQNSKTTTVKDLPYDIFTTARTTDIEAGYSKYEEDLRQMYKYAGVIASTYSNEFITLGYVTERLQDHDYENNSSIVNFVEYTSAVEKRNEMSSYGQNKSYPRNTALLQTDDSQHINIYNSFDSFVQHLVNLKFDFNGSTLRYAGLDVFNLNSDLGFIPQYADRCGLSRYYNNSALKNLSSYQIELLGPENSDVKFTPVIKTPTDESYGRVVEEYEPVTKFIRYTDELTIESNYNSVTAEFFLSDMISANALQDMEDSGELLKYKYMLFNTRYESMPILKGSLSATLPLSNFYLSSEEYDLLSGQEVIGPNNTSFQNVNMTNHINNISAIQMEVHYNSETMLPKSLTLTCAVRQIPDKDQVIPDQMLQLMVYKNNSLNTYKFYHIIENSNPLCGSQYMTEDQNYRIDFEQISAASALSEFKIDGKKPFKDYSGLSSYNQMSAQLEFKYSEEETINVEFPYLEENQIEDEIVSLQNNDQYIYFLALDNYDTLKINPFYIERYYPSSGQYGKVLINTNYATYRDFYNRAMQIEVTYNMERIQEDSDKFEVVMYFNYKNYTMPSYVDFKKSIPPVGKACTQENESLANTYLVLKPGESGRLDMRIDYVFYDKLNPSDIQYSIVGAKSDIPRSYYIMNVSDSKPKFVIQRTPFEVEKSVDETDNYELAEMYQDGIMFRYVRLVVVMNRGKGASSGGRGKYVSLSEIEFVTKDGEEVFKWPDATEELPSINIKSVVGYTPLRLIDGNKKTKFLGTSEAVATGGEIQFPVKIGFDLKSQCLDIKKYCKWRWYNPDNARTHYGYTPAEFYIEFSNDKTIWFKTKLVSKYDLTKLDEEKAYEETIELIQ